MQRLVSLAQKYIPTRFPSLSSLQNPLQARIPFFSPRPPPVSKTGKFLEEVQHVLYSTLLSFIAFIYSLGEREHRSAVDQQHVQ
jgi:hypothetical protein